MKRSIIMGSTGYEITWQLKKDPKISAHLTKTCTFQIIYFVFTIIKESLSAKNNILMEMWGEPEQPNDNFYIFTSWPESKFISLALPNHLVFGERQFGFDRCSNIRVNTKSNKCLVFGDGRTVYSHLHCRNTFTR